MTSEARAECGQLLLPDPPRLSAVWRPPEPADKSLRAVLWVLRIDGRSHERAEIAERTGLSERAVRRACAELREMGWPIISSSDRSGFRISFEHEDIERTVADLSSRIHALLKIRRSMKRVLVLRPAA